MSEEAFSVFADEGWAIAKDDEQKILMYKGPLTFGDGKVITNPYIRIGKKEKRVYFDCALSISQLNVITEYVNKLQEESINETA